MSILKTTSLPLSSLTGYDLSGDVSVDITYRIHSQETVAPSAKNLALFVEAVDKSGARIGDLRAYRFGTEPSPADPPSDILDPVTGQILVAAGENMPPLPSVSDLRAMPLPGGPKTVATVGDLWDFVRRIQYEMLVALDPEHLSGKEI